MPIWALFQQFDAKHPGLLKESKYREVFKEENWEAMKP